MSKASSSNSDKFGIDQYFRRRPGGTNSLSHLFAESEDTRLSKEQKTQSFADDPSPLFGRREGSASALAETSGSDGRLSAGDSGPGSGSQPANGLDKRLGKTGTRFTKHTRSFLRTWFNAHKENPYPTDEEKDELVEKTQLQRSQVSLWLANARRRHRSRKQASAIHFNAPDLAAPTDLASAWHTSLPLANWSSTMPPPPVPSTQPDFDSIQQMFTEMSPFERWRSDLDLEHEPAAPPAIASAVARTPSVNQSSGCRPNTTGNPSASTASGYEYDAIWAPSVANFWTELTSTIDSSLMSEYEGYSHYSDEQEDKGEAPAIMNQELPALPISRRRCKANRAPKKIDSESLTKKFQCTFCDGRTFKSKHDWGRHETSQHLDVESWTCCLAGPIFESPEGPICAFCDHKNPDSDHLETHQYSTCQEKDLAERTFYRKDHFQQHLRLAHGANFTPAMKAWNVESSQIESVCGFCSARFYNWKERSTHLAAHFKAGATMSDWIGPRGLGLAVHDF